MTTIRDSTVEDIPDVLAFWADATVEPSATDDADSVAALLGVDAEKVRAGSISSSWKTKPPRRHSGPQPDTSDRTTGSAT